MRDKRELGNRVLYIYVFFFILRAYFSNIMDHLAVTEMRLLAWNIYDSGIHVAIHQLSLSLRTVADIRQQSGTRRHFISYYRKTFFLKKKTRYKSDLFANLLPFFYDIAGQYCADCCFITFCCRKGLYSEGRNIAKPSLFKDRRKTYFFWRFERCARARKKTSSAYTYYSEETFFWVGFHFCHSLPCVFYDFIFC